MHIEHDDWVTEIKLPRIAQTLLAYLLLTPHHFYPREVLIDLFWSDHTLQQARSCLSTALWRLRRAIEPDDIPKGTYLLNTSAGEIGFNWDSDYWLDVMSFQETVEALTRKSVQAMDTVDIKNLSARLDLWTGDLLEGFYDDWLLSERERFRQLYLDGLEHLMLVYKNQRNFKQSLSYGQRILEHDPLRESIHRDLMRIYWEAGHPTKAVRQYHVCQEILARELKITPMTETQTLYAQILAATRQQQVEPVIARPDDFQQAMYQLQLALEECQKTQKNLQKAAALVQQYFDQQGPDT
jgi:DNA-binding SARP family transcriptional activator